ncbi:hypothetical protein JQ608_38475 [Bradyrhizobium liaoningense]|uniref:hypothetical protein n=1 Tax=Bradyrhizobium liaoningense TaxID=43992 RepID=UPI001BA7F632|nr:hypothetical protein [Bradyrhizobium liaoningense]MBR0882911.1 hypothetical protein [Bradyrhizobium liaoningense]
MEPLAQHPNSATILSSLRSVSKQSTKFLLVRMKQTTFRGIAALMSQNRLANFLFLSACAAAGHYASVILVSALARCGGAA